MSRLVFLSEFILIRICVFGQRSTPTAPLPSGSTHLAVIDSDDTAGL